MIFLNTPEARAAIRRVVDTAAYATPGAILHLDLTTHGVQLVQLADKPLNDAEAFVTAVPLD